MRHGQRETGHRRHIVFSGSLFDSRVSCLSQRVEVVLVLGFLQAWWGSTAALSFMGLQEHFPLSNRGTAPTPPPQGMCHQGFTLSAL